MHAFRAALPGLLLLLAWGCSGRDDGADAGPRPDAGAREDAGGLPDAGAACECAPGAHNELVFLMSDDGELWSWDPRTGDFAFVVGPVCSGMDPFSMGVDAQGLAWVLFFESLSILTFDVNDPGTCEPSTYVRRDPSYGLFGMSFATSGPTDTCEKLYVHTYDGDGPFEEGPGLGRLGVIDPGTGELSTIATIDYDGGELTGTGDGRLYALAGADPVKLVQYDRETGAALETIPLAGFRKTNASAVAFHSGDIYIFVEAVPPGCRTCLEDTCPSDYAACLEDETCSEHLGCAIEAADVRDDCGGLLPEAMMSCLVSCESDCFVLPRNRVSLVARYDLDGSEGGGDPLEVVVEQAPIRVVGAATSPCVQTVPF